MPAKVFISYSTVDLATVKRAKAVLEAAGHSAYVAEYSALGGTRLPEEIKQAIASSDFVVVFWSSNAKGSAWVDQEIGIAEAHGKMVIPVVLESGVVPGGFLSDRKYVSAIDDPDAALANLRQIIEIEKRKRDVETAKALGVLGLLVLLVAATSD